MVRNGSINKNSKNPNDLRTHVVIETNKDDLAIVRITSKKPGTTRLKCYQNGKSYFKHFVEIEDVNKKPLRLGENITQNHKNMDLSLDNVKYIQNVISNSKQKDHYEKNINKFRNRYKKN